MKSTILLTNHYEGIPLEILKKAVGDRFDLKVLDKADQGELCKRACEADYFLVSGRLRIDEAVIKNAGRLKMVQRTGVGIDNMDLACLKSRGIPLYVNRGVNAVSVAEHTVMLMLSTIKKSYAVNRQMRDGIWKKQQTGLTTHELAGKRVGLIGMGSIGRAVAGMLSGFNVHILYYDKVRLSADMEEHLQVTYTEFQKLLAESDIISLHCGYDPEAGCLITARELALLRPGAVLINTARGKLVEEAALIAALKNGRLSACGIDTFETEPPQGITELAAFDQVLLSPHIAGVSYEAFSRMMEMAIGNIHRFEQGKTHEIRTNRIV